MSVGWQVLQIVGENGEGKPADCTTGLGEV